MSFEKLVNEIKLQKGNFLILAPVNSGKTSISLMLAAALTEGFKSVTFNTKELSVADLHLKLSVIVNKNIDSKDSLMSNLIWSTLDTLDNIDKLLGGEVFVCDSLYHPLMGLNLSKYMLGSKINILTMNKSPSYVKGGGKLDKHVLGFDGHIIELEKLKPSVVKVHSDLCDDFEIDFGNYYDLK